MGDQIDREAAIAAIKGSDLPFGPVCAEDTGYQQGLAEAAAALLALPSATQAGVRVKPLEGSVMVAIPIRLAREFRDHVVDEMAAWHDDTAYQDDLRAFASALDAAPLPPAPEDGA